MKCISSLRPKRKLRGFTLIELMIAVAIVAIIAAVALPAYQGAVHKGKRADALAAVAAIQQSQERWRANSPAYSTSLTQLAVNEPASYELVITAPVPETPASLGTGYIVVANGRGTQADDSLCKRMSVKVVDGNLSYAGCGTCSTFTYTPSHACWAR